MDEKKKKMSVFKYIPPALVFACVASVPRATARLCIRYSCGVNNPTGILQPPRLTNLPNRSISTIISRTTATTIQVGNTMTPRRVCATTKIVCAQRPTAPTGAMRSNSCPVTCFKNASLKINRNDSHLQLNIKIYNHLTKKMQQIKPVSHSVATPGHKTKQAEKESGTPLIKISKQLVLSSLNKVKHTHTFKKDELLSAALLSEEQKEVLLSHQPLLIQALKQVRKQSL